MRYSVALTLLLFLLSPCFVVQAQNLSATGIITGTVIDSSNAPVPDAEITARNEDTLATRNAKSDQEGRFYVSALSIGTYTLRVMKPGFAGIVVSRFLLSVGEVSVHQIQLRVASVQEELSVAEKPEAVDAAAASSSVALGDDRIEEAPASNRNYLNFALLAPGIAASSGSNAQLSTTAVRNPLVDSGFTFGGMRGRNNSITIDGLDNRDETTGANRVAIGFEMVQEFRVSSTSVGAEAGGSAGGVVNMVTRSGTNVWHGDVTFFAQNEALNAKKPEVESTFKPEFHRYQPGTSTNGPIRKDRTFISAAVEYERESSQEWSGPYSVDTINTILQTSAFSGTGVHSISRGLFDAGVRGLDASAKINHQIDAQNALTARYAFSRGRLLNDVQNGDNFTDSSALGSSLTTDHSFAADWLRVPSPALVNDLKFQIAQREMEVRPNSVGPMLEIPGVATFGESDQLNSNRTERHYQVVESVEYGKGIHHLNAGVDVHWVDFDAALRNRYAGIFVFPTLADFQAARPDVFIQAFGDPHTQFNTLPVGLWFQDNIQLARGLRLQAGFRFDRQRMPDGFPSSSNNLAPRLGLAWSPGGMSATVFRAAFGLFYDRYPLAFLNEAAQKNARAGFEQYLVGADAFRIFSLTHSSAPVAPLSGISPATCLVSSNFPSTYARKVAVGLEHGFGRNSTLTIEASQVHGLHLPKIENINVSLPAEYQLQQTASSSYQGVAVSFNRRLSHELAILLVYDVSRTNDNSSDFTEQPMIPLNTRLDWSRSRQDQFQRVAFSSLLDLPAEEFTFLPEKYRDYFEDIGIAPILTVGSGRPINALATTDLFRTGAYPITARPFGLPRNPFRSSGTVSLDLRIMKSVDILDRRAKLQFGAESFNLTNHTNVLRVSPYFAAASQRLDTYDGIIESLSGRQVQLVFHIEY